METVDEVWVDDLLDRRREAIGLIDYIESVVAVPSLREDNHALVIAVDSTYGQGKTFFLRRLNRHLRATDHVSAYIDAWKDDLEDEPLVALAATLEYALADWIAKPGVGEKLATFKQKAGKIVQLAGIGLLKRGAGFVFTAGVAEAIGDTITATGDAIIEAKKDAAKKTGEGLVDDISAGLSASGIADMDTRIARFKSGQAAIEEMKASLLDVVETLTDAGMCCCPLKA